MGSRRGCEELITTGQVTVNGNVCTSLATEVAENDVVKVGNRVIRVAAPMHILLNKPPGYLCTAADTHDRRTIFDLLPPNFPRLFNVGRLDKESEGLIILTNDGDLSLKLTHPRYKIDKEYEVVLDQPYDTANTDRLLAGMRLTDGWAKAEAVHKLASNKLKIVLRQGMKRQIRLMLYEVGYEVEKLVRTRIGPLRIEGLPTGHWRALTQKEVTALLTSGEKEASNKPETTQKRQKIRSAPRSPRPAGKRPDRPGFGPKRSSSSFKPKRDERTTEGGERDRDREFRSSDARDKAKGPRGASKFSKPERGFRSDERPSRGGHSSTGAGSRKSPSGSKFSAGPKRPGKPAPRPFRDREEGGDESRPRRVEWAEPPRRAPRVSAAKNPKEFGAAKLRRRQDH